MTGLVFRVQGRLIERHGLVIVRDQTRLADAGSRDEATLIADVLHADGYTVWVWAVDGRTAPAEWELVERLDQLRRPSASPRSAGPGRPAGTRARAATA